MGIAPSVDVMLDDVGGGSTDEDAMMLVDGALDLG